MSHQANEIVHKIARDLLELQRTYSTRFKRCNSNLIRKSSSGTLQKSPSNSPQPKQSVQSQPKQSIQSQPKQSVQQQPHSSQATPQPRIENSSVYISPIEEAILRSNNFPVLINETEQVSALGERGIYANKCEANNWKGEIPLSDYTLNEDDNPQVITKKVAHQLEYIQELAVRYLRPPTPPAPGEIIIKQEANKLSPPAPPIVIRQQPPRPKTPEPLIFREAPPLPPEPVGKKLITISGKHLPPPPRKVVIERLAPLPDKPQAVIVERWLPYTPQKRKVIFKPAPPDPVIPVKNVLIQWETPEVLVKTTKKYLGVVRANPAEYVKKYGESLKKPSELPKLVLDIPTPAGISLAADHKPNTVPELEGDVEALKLVDLDSEGLSEYKSLFPKQEEKNLKKSVSNSSLAAHIDALFKAIDHDKSGTISINEAARIVLKINSRLGRSYGEDDVINFMSALDINGDNKITLDEFRNAMFLLSE